MATPADPLAAALAGIVGAADVLARPIDRAIYASDASIYRLVPRLIARPQTVDQVREVLDCCRRAGTSVTFRTAGTSLSGQAVTDGVILDLSRHWRGIDVLDNGRRVRVQPGAIGAQVNMRLRPFGTKIGPDPASIQACMIGGILANNSSGMCCGVAQNAYHTLDSLVFLLPSGTLIDTSAEDADERLSGAEPDLVAGLLAMTREVADRPSLTERIRHKYRSKNTTGYSLNALIDFTRPSDILAHLLVGSEGTLAFLASAVLRTVPSRAVRYTGLLLFPSVRDACQAIRPLRDAGAAALEVMDRAALRAVETQPGVPPSIGGLPPGAAGLLVEFQADDERDRPTLEAVAREATAGLTVLTAPGFTHDEASQAALWRVRQGMFPSVGASRRRGTAVLIEDVAFPVDRLADAVVDLQALFARHGYRDAIIFGHAREGNLHFVLSQSFNDDDAVAQYARLMDDVVSLVAERYDGALKAEHGTGRNMAPFVEREWGAEAYGLMRRIKALVDPTGLLNPGIVFSDRADAHLQHLKTLPAVDDEVDRCIECGYCEPVCPSRDLTTSPRQRIVVRRELERLKDQPDRADLMAAIERDVPHDTVDTCAVDGLCATACPVAIDTGRLTKRLRTWQHPPSAHRMAQQVVRRFARAEVGVRATLRLAYGAERLLGHRLLAGITRLPARLFGRQVPAWIPPMPRAASGRLPATPREAAVAVYFPSCLSRTMGSLPGEDRDLDIVEALVEVAARAGQPVWIPEDVAGHCCGVPFGSKGYVDAHREMVNRTVSALWRWSDGGRLPIVVDTSPCTYGLRACRPDLSAENRLRFDQLRLLDSIAFVAETVLPHLQVRRRTRRVVLHPVCSVVKMNLRAEFEHVAHACAEEVVVPLEAGCCGFAGDRGWLVPELTAAATRQEAAEVRAAAAGGHYSSSRTCEIGMTRATGSVYRSFLFLVEWASRPDPGEANARVL